MARFQYTPCTCSLCACAWMSACATPLAFKSPNRILYLFVYLAGLHKCVQVVWGLLRLLNVPLLISPRSPYFSSQLILSLVVLWQSICTLRLAKLNSTPRRKGRVSQFLGGLQRCDCWILICAHLKSRKTKVNRESEQNRRNNDCTACALVIDAKYNYWIHNQCSQSETREEEKPLGETMGSHALFNRRIFWLKWNRFRWAPVTQISIEQSEKPMFLFICLLVWLVWVDFLWNFYLDVVHVLCERVSVA